MSTTHRGISISFVIKTVQTTLAASLLSACLHDTPFPGLEGTEEEPTDIPVQSAPAAGSADHFVPYPGMPYPYYPPDMPIPEGTFEGELTRVSLSAAENCDAVESFLLDQWVEKYLAEGDYCEYCYEPHYPSSFGAMPFPGPVQQNTTKAGSDNTLYLLRDGYLKIVKALPAAEMSEQGSLMLQGAPQGLFLDEAHSQVIVVGSIQGPYMSEPFHYPPGMESFPPPIPPNLPTPTLTITFVDVSDKSNPTVVRTIDLDGQYFNVLQAGDRLLAIGQSSLQMPVEVTNDTLFRETVDKYRQAKSLHELYSFVIENSENEPSTELTSFGAGTAALVEELRAMIMTSISGALDDGINDMLPDYTTSSADETQSVNGELLTCGDIYLPDIDEGNRVLTTVTQINMSDGAMASLGMVIQPHTTYMGDENLYVLQSRALSKEAMESRQTSVFQISTAGDKPAYIASGVLRGDVDGLRHVDEYSGVLRAFSTERVFVPEVHSDVQTVHLTLLMANTSGELAKVGELHNFAPGESMASAAFAGNKAFAVTNGMRNLFYTIDLSIQSAPALAGTLELTGGSSTLTVLDSNHLFSLGQEHDPQMQRERLIARIYDVSDLTQPTQSHSSPVVSDSRGYIWSAAVFDNALITYDPVDKLVYFPVEKEDWETNNFFRGLVGLRIDTDTGITSVGRVDHVDLVSDSMCNTGMTPTDTKIAPDGAIYFSAPFYPGMCDDPMWRSHFYFGDMQAIVLRDGDTGYLATISLVGIKLHENDRLSAAALNTLAFTLPVANTAIVGNTTTGVAADHATHAH